MINRFYFFKQKFFLKKSVKNHQIETFNSKSLKKTEIKIKKLRSFLFFTQKVTTKKLYLIIEMFLLWDRLAEKKILRT